MGRIPRIHYPGALYHVIARGHNRWPVFAGDTAKGYFLSLMDEVFAKFAVALHVYCLMDNHFHMLLQVAQVALEKAMHDLQSRYAQKFNWLSGRDGAVFGGRYRSILCQSDRYLLNVLRYIHRNPVQAGIVASVEDWRWSSHRAYLGFPEANVTTSLCLSYFGEGRDALESYRTFMDADVPAKWPHPGIPEWDDPEVNPKDLASKFELGVSDRLASMLETFARERGVSKEEILSKSRERRLYLVRVEFTVLALEAGFKLIDIGRQLGRSPSTMTELLARLAGDTEKDTEMVPGTN